MKNKWIAILFFVCCACLCVYTSRLICTTDAEILHHIAGESGVEHADALMLVDIIISDDKTEALVICELGEPYVSRIFAWRFHVLGHRIFIPNRGYAQNDDSRPIKTFIWGEKYVVVINDISAKSYGVVLDGQEEIVEIGSYPTVLQLPLTTIGNIIYYDENMEVIG